MIKYKYILPIIGISIGSMLYFGMTLLNESHPIESFRRVVSQETVHRSDTVIITSNVMRSKDGCTSTIRRRWFDSSGNIFYNTDVQRQALPAGLENFYVDLVIPPTVSLGTLRLNTDVEFYCNFVQKTLQHGTHFPLPDIFFQVVK